jgi:hypothetical protein
VSGDAALLGWFCVGSCAMDGDLQTKLEKYEEKAAKCK